MSTSNVFTKVKNVSALIVTKPSTALVFASTNIGLGAAELPVHPLGLHKGISLFISSETAHRFSAPSNYVPMRYRRLWCHVPPGRRLDPALPPSARRG